MRPQVQEQIGQLLKNELDERKKRNPRYSLRKFAKNLNISPSSLSEIFKGSRSLSRSKAKSILLKSGVRPEQIQQILVQFVSEKKMPTRKKLLKTELHSQYFFQVISDWKYYAILSLFETDSSSGTFEEVVSRLNIPEAQAQYCLNLLCELKMLEKIENGKYALTGHQFTTTDNIPSSAIQMSHLQNFAMARRALKKIPVDTRDFTASTLAIDPSQLHRAKKIIRNFHRKMSEVLEKDPKKEVYKLCVQLFPLTQVNRTHN